MDETTDNSNESDGPQFVRNAMPYGMFHSIQRRETRNLQENMYEPPRANERLTSPHLFHSYSCPSINLFMQRRVLHNDEHIHESHY